jgi:hypothetical protein
MGPLYREALEEPEEVIKVVVEEAVEDFTVGAGVSEEDLDLAVKQVLGVVVDLVIPGGIQML